MISVIIPTYNRGDLIKRSIESVLNQTYQDIELIIVDDNSSDNTEQVVLSLNDERIKYIKQHKNVGANKARNIGIEISKGDYIAFNDSDDEWLPNKLEIQLDRLKSTNSDLVFCACHRYEDDDVILAPTREINSDTMLRDLLRGNFISTQNILATKECLVSEMFDNSLPRFQDWDLVIRIAKKYKIEFCKEPLTNVYVQNDSISKNSQKAVDALNIMREKYKDDLSKDKKAISRWYRMSMEYACDSKDRTKYLISSIKSDPLNIRNIASYIKHTFK